MLCPSWRQVVGKLPQEDDEDGHEGGGGNDDDDEEEGAAEGSEEGGEEGDKIKEEGSFTPRQAPPRQLASLGGAPHFRCVLPEGPVRVLIFSVKRGHVRIALKLVRALPVEISHEHRVPLQPTADEPFRPPECHGCCACLGLFPGPTWRRRLNDL